MLTTTTPPFTQVHVLDVTAATNQLQNALASLIGRGLIRSYIATARDVYFAPRTADPAVLFEIQQTMAPFIVAGAHSVSDTNIRVKANSDEWKPQAISLGRRSAELAEAGMAYEITFYCDTREQAGEVDEYMQTRCGGASWTTVVSQNPHEMDDE